MTMILIAEDEPDIRDLVSITLKFAGFEVEATNNGIELLERAPQVKPALILMDVRMPRMTGYEACKALKANPALAHIPVVFLSAKGQEEEVRLGMQSGAEAYVIKPFAPDELVLKVKDILARVAAQPATPPAATPPAPAPAAPAPTPTPAPSAPSQAQPTPPAGPPPAAPAGPPPAAPPPVPAPAAPTSPPAQTRPAAPAPAPAQAQPTPPAVPPPAAPAGPPSNPQGGTPDESKPEPPKSGVQP